MALSSDDHAAIQQLYARYNHALDLGDAPGWAATFTEDGVFNSGAGGSQEGREALEGFARGFAERMKARHWINNLVVDGDGDTAKGSCYLVLWNLAQQPPAPMITAIYNDELVKQNGEWKFTNRSVSADGQ